MGTVVRVRAGTSQHYEQVTSRGYGAQVKTAGVTEYQGYRWMAENVACTNEAWSVDASVGLGKLAPLDLANPTGVSSRLLAMADALTLTWPELPVAQPRLPGGHPPSGWTANQQRCIPVLDNSTRITASPR